MKFPSRATISLILPMREICDMCITLQVTSQPLLKMTENDQKDGKNYGDPCSYSKADMHKEQNIPSMSESDLCIGMSLQ